MKTFIKIEYIQKKDIQRGDLYRIEAYMEKKLKWK